MISVRVSRAGLLQTLALVSSLVLVAGFSILSVFDFVRWYPLISFLLSARILMILVSRQAYISAFFLALNLEFAIAIFVKVVIGDYEASSWRQAYYQPEAAREAYLYVVHFLNLVAISFFVLSKSVCYLDVTSTSASKNRSIYCLLVILFLFAFFVIDYKHLAAGKFEYGSVGSGFPFLEVVSILSYIGIVDFRAINSSVIGRLSLGLLVFAVLSILIYGFRGIFMGCVVVLAAVMYSRGKISLSRLAFWFCVLILVFLVIAVARSGAGVSMAALTSMLGQHEENEFYTVIISFENEGFYGGLSYFYSMSRMVGANLLTTNSMFANDFLPKEIVVGGANMGMYFFSEAVLNFGRVGGLIFSALACFLISVLERMSKYALGARCLCIVVLTQVYTLVYYGSSNFLSIVVNGGIIVGLYAIYVRWLTSRI